MIENRVVCDVCKVPVPAAEKATVIGGQVHVCNDCNQGPAAELVRAVVAAWPKTCRCAGMSLGQWQQAMGTTR